MPPLHPHCRSTIAGSLKGDSTPKGSRAARDRVGKYIRVPADMKYEDWKAVYIDGKISPKEWRVNALFNSGIVKDVTNKYFAAKDRLTGEFVIPEQGVYAKSNHKEEIRIGKILYDSFGGDFRLLGEINKQNIKTADYLWNGKYWELKNISSVNAANNAIRKGLKQITSNPGGLVVWLDSSDITINILLTEVVNRLYRSATIDTTVIIGRDDEVIHVLEYTKK